MIRSYATKYATLLIGLCLAFTCTNAWAQARLILNNGSFINIRQSAYLVIANPAANAITRISSGHILSEGENNIVKWNIGTTAANYVIPWGYGTTNYIPVSFTTSSAAGVSGFINFSTYHTTWDNSGQLPSGVTTFSSGSTADNSAFVLDRFWQINAQGYTTKPTLTNLLFTYLDVEHSVANNTISESNLKAQRYNSTSNVWGDYSPAGTVSMAANTMTTASIVPADCFRWWALVDLAMPLPVELLSFSATPSEKTVSLRWSTATEINNDYFTIQRSSDGIEFLDLTKVIAGSDGKTVQAYSYNDIRPLSQRSYYRLKQTDFDGAYKFSEIRKVDRGDEVSHVTMNVFPNPVTDSKFSIDFSESFETATAVTVHDLVGNLIIHELVGRGIQIINVDLEDSPAGVYVVKAVNTQFSFQKIVVLK
jgi:hypothetical protein